MVNWYYNSIIRFLSTISKLVMAENYFRLYHICSEKNDLLLSIADAYKFFFFSRIFELRWITRTWMPFLVNIRNHAMLTKVWCSLHKIDVVVVLIIYELFSIQIMYWTLYILFFTDWHNWWWIHFIFMMIHFTFFYNSFFQIWFILSKYIKCNMPCNIDLADAKTLNATSVVRCYILLPQL
jgi:hypothetical protein